jgi:transcriptional regulator with XRE-family HTH domain
MSATRKGIIWPSPHHTPLRAARIAKDMTAKELAEKVGVGVPGVCNFERGGHISPPRKVQLARVLGKTPAELFGPDRLVEAFDLLPDWALEEVLAWSHSRAPNTAKKGGRNVQE